MKPFLIILGLLLVVILQTTFIPFFTVSGVGPNLVLLLVLLLVIFRGFREIWWNILLVGLFLDVLSGLPFGLLSLSLLGSAYLIDWFNRNIFSQINFWVIVFLIGLGNLVYYLLLWGLKNIL